MKALFLATMVLFTQSFAQAKANSCEKEMAVEVLAHKLRNSDLKTILQNQFSVKSINVVNTEQMGFTTSYVVTVEALNVVDGTTVASLYGVTVLNEKPCQLSISGIYE